MKEAMYEANLDDSADVRPSLAMDVGGCSNLQAVDFPCRSEVGRRWLYAKASAVMMSNLLAASSMGVACGIRFRAVF